MVKQKVYLHISFFYTILFGLFIVMQTPEVEVQREREQSSPCNHCKSPVRKRKFLVCGVDTIEMQCHLSEWRTMAMHEDWRSGFFLDAIGMKPWSDSLL